MYVWLLLLHKTLPYVTSGSNMIPCRVNPGKYGQRGKYGQMAYTSHVQEHRSVTKKCFISALNIVYSALLHPYTT